MNEDTRLQTAHSLRQHKEKILALWSERARQEIPAASEKSELVLRDALPLFLNNLVRTLSPNEPEDSSCQTEVSQEHAEQRDRQGDYSLRQVVSEYFILQKTIFEVLEMETGQTLTATSRDIILESLAKGIEEAGVKFSKLQVSRLKASNQALEHFAHLASHDLQEPLRTIASHLGLIQKKLANNLDKDLTESFEFVTGAAKRMKALIDSLLVYSQVGHFEKEKSPTDFNVALKRAISNLQVAIVDSHARVTSDPLPTLLALPLEIERLFQNLISNALKFRSERLPTIHISAVSDNKQWVFSVCDNGIGIDPEQGENIFKLFSRLHSPHQIPGSGIGLSVCRKVLELHDGAVWTEPNPQGGTVFFFSIPADANMRKSKLL